MRSKILWLEQRYGIIFYLSVILGHKPYWKNNDQSLQSNFHWQAGSEHCVSDGHLTDTEEADHAAISHEPAYIREIEVLKECLKKQVRKVFFSSSDT